MQTLNSREVYANAWMTVREDGVRRADGSEGIFGASRIEFPQAGHS